MPKITLQPFDGQIASAATAIYTVPGETEATLRALTLLNTHPTTTMTVIVYIRKSGSTRRQIVHQDLAPGSAHHYGLPQYMRAKDAILGTATSAGAVDYYGSVEEKVTI